MTTRSNAADLCQRFAYPSELADVLDSVVALADEHLGPVASIVVSPSISTGDFLFRRTGSATELLSDIDGFIYMEGRVRNPAGWEAAIAQLRSRHGALFDIDMPINPLSQLARLPETYQFVETGLQGFVLAGAQVLSRFPTRFDPRASRQAFLRNLEKPLRYRNDDARFAQNCARLLLDIPILASSEAGRCIAGHAARARWFLEQDPGPLARDPVIREAVAAARAARQSPPGERSQLEPRLWPALERSIELLDGRGPLAGSTSRALEKRLRAWLPPRSLRRRGGELRSVLRRRSTWRADLAWLRRPKEAAGGAALLALLAFQNQPSEALATSAAESIERFARRRIAKGGPDFVDLALSAYAEGLCELYPSLVARRGAA